MGPFKSKSLILIYCGILVLCYSHTNVARAESMEDAEDPTEFHDDLLDDEETEPSPKVTVTGSDLEIEYITPTPSGPVHFSENFDDYDISKAKWIVSRATKEEQDNTFKYDGRWEFELPQKQIFPTDRSLVLRSKAQHAAISAKLNKKFDFLDKPLFVQYEVNFQNGMDCGGAYIKLLSYSKEMKLDKFHDKSPYTIMFGPDKCGSDVKLHFIFRHKNPINGSFEEKHFKKTSTRIEEMFSDKKPHLYRLVVRPDNSFEIQVDDRIVNKGNLLEDMEPPVNPPKEIEDPNDTKPADWDEREKIPDSNAVKPEDWDDEAPPKIPDPKAVKPKKWLDNEPEMIPDPNAKVPEDWDEFMDGSWEAPLVNNPACTDAVGCGPWSAPLVKNPQFKGVWKPPMISNPDYKGKWTHKIIPNPDYFEDKEPFKMTSIGAVGLEIWTMTDLVLFDNFIITDDEDILNDWTTQTYTIKRKVLDRDVEGIITRIINFTNAHSWLWAIYVFVIGIPIVLFFIFWCGKDQDEKTDDPARTKKTDEATKNDIPPGMARKSEPSTSDSQLKKKSVPKSEEKVTSEKEQLENVENESEDEEEDESYGNLEDEELIGQNDLEENSEATNSVAPPSITKRRTRRD